MQDKQSFGKYIYEKRKKRNMTQEELAKKLFVLPTTISKWERGITYPDITLIPKLCKELAISEHEFFTACDDLEREREKRELNKYHNIIKIAQKFLTISYLLGILISFIVDFCINQNLSWSWIVLLGVLISWTITDLPFLLKQNKYKGIKISIALMILIPILLFTINIVNNGTWFIKSLIIAYFVLFFLFFDVLLWTFSKIKTTKKISITLIIVALLTIIINPFSQKVLEITAKESNIPNILSAGVMIILAIFLFFYKGREQ